MNKETIINYLKLEKEIYSKIFDLNLIIINILNKKNFEIKQLEKFLSKRESLINEIKKIEEKLNKAWENWEKYSNSDTNEKLQDLKNLIIKNIELEKKIVKLYEEKISEIKLKLKEYERGKRALTGYKIAKVNLPMFKSFKV